jgi:hypothetical protein
MPLLTIFSAPKPFSDPHIDTIQRNGIQSWLHLGSEVEVILIGEEPGLEQVAAEYGVKLLMNVERNEKGTPLVSSIFELALRASDSPLLVYVNADILLMPDIVLASFPRHLFTDVPDFAIGRAGWDNWMIYYARQQGWLVVDGTPSIMVIHQCHDYGHLPGGKPHYTLEESLDNEALAGGSANLYMVLDCEKQLRDGRLSSPSITLVRSLRRAEVWLTPADGVRQGRRWRLARSLRRTRRKITGTL